MILLVLQKKRDLMICRLEKKKLEEELHYTKGFLKSVQSKLQNEKFMAGAPEQVVAMERKKEADAMSTIAVLEEKLTSLN